MISRDTSAEPRLLIVGDLTRLAPIVTEAFAPNRIDGVHTYLEGIAEVPRSPTRAVLVGYDPTCRNPEAAIAAIKKVAADVPVVVCCEPAYEDAGRRLRDFGADDYVIFPPDSGDLEKTLGIPARRTQRRWLATPDMTPAPSAEELALLADLLPRMGEGEAVALEAMAALICVAVDAECAMVVLDERSGVSGCDGDRGFHPALIEPIIHGQTRVGQIRVGKCRRGGYSREQVAKLHHYGSLFGRIHAFAVKARQWRALAMTDDLTGLPNRRHLLRYLSEIIELAKRDGRTVTALVFDIDDFKRYNDAYGHDAGDQILVEVGQLFVQCSRRTDMVARYGGDEFVVVFWDPEGPRSSGSRHPEAVIEVVSRFREALRQHRFSRLGPEAQGRLTISGGLAHYPSQATQAEPLIEAADQALLKAKEAGKNRFWVIGAGSVESGSCV